MKFKVYLNSLNDSQMLHIIEDLNYLKNNGELPKESFIRDISKMVCEDYKIPFNLTYGIDAVKDEIVGRYNELIRTKI